MCVACGPDCCQDCAPGLSDLGGLIRCYMCATVMHNLWRSSSCNTLIRSFVLRWSLWSAQQSSKPRPSRGMHRNTRIAMCPAGEGCHAVVSTTVNTTVYSGKGDMQAGRELSTKHIPTDRPTTQTHCVTHARTHTNRTTCYNKGNNTPDQITSWQSGSVC